MQLVAVQEDEGGGVGSRHLLHGLNAQQVGGGPPAGRYRPAARAQQAGQDLAHFVQAATGWLAAQQAGSGSPQRVLAATAARRRVQAVQAWAAKSLTRHVCRARRRRSCCCPLPALPIWTAPCSAASPETRVRKVHEQSVRRVVSPGLRQGAAHLRSAEGRRWGRAGQGACARCSREGGRPHTHI
jgi:hypothetical protein